MVGSGGSDLSFLLKKLCVSFEFKLEKGSHLPQNSFKNHINSYNSEFLLIHLLVPNILIIYLLI